MDYKHILKHWNIIKPTNIKKMKSFNNKTCSIIDYKAKKYVLKEKDNIKRINCEYYLLFKLINHNIPVSIPIKTINNSIYVTYKNKLYCLYRYIAGKVYENHYSLGANKRAKNYGTAIAQLHKGRECSPFDLDMNICYTCGLGKEKKNEPQELDI